MYRLISAVVLGCACSLITGCHRDSAAAAPAAEVLEPLGEKPGGGPHRIRATGTIQALRSLSIRTPQIAGQQGRITLIGLIPNGAKVSEGGVLAEFDPTQELENAREAESKFEELTNQLEQRRAQYRSDTAKRRAELKEAEADLEKARLQLKRGPLLSEIDRLKTEDRAASTEARVESLKRSHALREKADHAAIRILELQRERQQVAVERTQRNLGKLTVRAPLSGMVAQEQIWRNGTVGPPQEGDQMFPNQALVRIFDPSAMVVQVSVEEPDGIALTPGCRAKIHVDAYPEAVFDGVLEAASPVASSPLGSPIKIFAATFRVLQQDAQLLPDLSAAVEIDVSGDTR